MKVFSKVVLILFLELATHSSALRRKTEGQKSASTIVGRVVQRMMKRMEASGVNMTLSQACAGEIVEEIEVKSASFSQVQTSEEKSFCKEQRNFDFDDLKREMQEGYTQVPWSCLKKRPKDRADKVFRLFGDKARTARYRRNRMAHFVTNCIFQDTVERFGGSGGIWSDEGFNEWDKKNLDKFPGLQKLATEQVRQTYTNSNKQMAEGLEDVMWMLSSVAIQLTGLYPRATNDQERYFIKEKLKKLYLIYFGTFVFSDVASGKEKMTEAMFIARVWFYDNVQWAVNVEKLGVSRGAVGADPENVKMGEKINKIFKHCFINTFSAKPPQLHTEADGDLVEKGFLLYTLWNHRYVHQFKNTDSTKAMCARRGSSKWRLAPWTILHTVIALALPLNGGARDLNDWMTFRNFGLGIVGTGSQEDCDGNMFWLKRI